MDATSSLSKRRPKQNIISMILAKGTSVCSSASSRSSWARTNRDASTVGGGTRASATSYSSATSRDILRSAVELTRQTQRKLATTVAGGRSGSSPRYGGRGGKRAGHYVRGQRAFYRSTRGIVKVTIVGVHHDSKLVPYYTIQLRDGSEKQTDGKHLTPLLDDATKSVGSKSTGGGGGGSSASGKERGGAGNDGGRSRSKPKRGDGYDRSDSLTDEHMTESSSEGGEMIRGGGGGGVGSKALEDNNDDVEAATKGEGGGSQSWDKEDDDVGKGGEGERNGGGDGGGGCGGTESSSEGGFWEKMKLPGPDVNDIEPMARVDGNNKFQVGQYAYYRPPDEKSVIKVRIVRHSKTKDRYAVSLPDGSHQENVKPSHLTTLMELSSNEMIRLMKEGNKPAERSSRVDRSLHGSSKSDEGDDGSIGGGKDGKPSSSGTENFASRHRASSPTEPSLSASLTAAATASPPQQAVRMVQAKTEDGKWKTVPMYESGMRINYTNADGTQNGTILTVHLDDLMEPYYTVLLQDGKEKQTDNAHITLRVEDQFIPHPYAGKEDEAKKGRLVEEETPPVSKRSSSKNRPREALDEAITQNQERTDPSSEASAMTYMVASFFNDDQVLYKSSDGECHRAIVVKLQRDKKNRPYYVVRLQATGKEKLVYGHRLQPLVHDYDRNAMSRSRSKSVSSTGGKSQESGRERGRSASKPSKSPGRDEYRERGEPRPSLRRNESITSHRSKRSVSRESHHSSLSNSSRRSQVIRESKNTIRDDSKATSSSRRDESMEPTSRRRRESSLTPSTTRGDRRERTESSLRGQQANDASGASRSRSSSVRRYFSSTNTDSRRNRESSRSRAPSEDSRRSALNTSTRSQDGKLSHSRGVTSRGNDRSSIQTIPKSVRKGSSSDNGREAGRLDDAHTPAISKLKSFRKSFAQLTKSAK
jgi:hypothetical protein